MTEKKKRTPEEDEIVKRMEEHGPAQIRVLLSNGGWPQAYHPLAMEWLREKDEPSKSSVAKKGPAGGA